MNHLFVTTHGYTVDAEFREFNHKRLFPLAKYISDRVDGPVTILTSPITEVADKAIKLSHYIPTSTVQMQRMLAVEHSSEWREPEIYAFRDLEKRLPSSSAIVLMTHPEQLPVFSAEIAKKYLHQDITANYDAIHFDLVKKETHLWYNQN
jgi:hypothetical protein